MQGKSAGLIDIENQINLHAAPRHPVQIDGAATICRLVQAPTSNPG